MTTGTALGSTVSRGCVPSALLAEAADELQTPDAFAGAAAYAGEGVIDIEAEVRVRASESAVAHDEIESEVSAAPVSQEAGVQNVEAVVARWQEIG